MGGAKGELSTRVAGRELTARRTIEIADEQPIGMESPTVSFVYHPGTWDNIGAIISPAIDFLSYFP